MPIEPAAPGWFTITTFWPSAFSSSAAVTRVTWSVEPPADQGTMMVIGFDGFHCAAAANEARASAAATATRTKRLGVILLLLARFFAGVRFNRFVKRLQRDGGLD